MRITSLLPLILLQLPLSILAYPNALPTSPTSLSNDPAKRVIAHVPSTAELLNSTSLQPLSNTTSLSLPLSTDFPIPKTPISLGISLRGPLIPLIYLSAALTTALRFIAPNVSAEARSPIPENSFRYRDRISGVRLEYEGFIDKYELSWQQLSWTFVGLLRFVEMDEGNSRQRVEAWVKVWRREKWAVPYGTVVVAYEGRRGSG